MNYTMSSALFLLLILFSACSDPVRDDSIGTDANNIHQPIDPVEPDDEEPKDLGPINEDNKELYDALVPLESGILPKEMNLDSEGFSLLPVNIIGEDPDYEYTLFGEYRFESNGEHALIIRVESYNSDELNFSRDDAQYYLISFDKMWNVADRKKIHAKNSIVAGKLVSNGWYQKSQDGNLETSEINIVWIKILIEEGKIVIVDEDTTRFEGSKDGSNKAKQFVEDIHTKEWR